MFENRHWLIIIIIILIMIVIVIMMGIMIIIMRRLNLSVFVLLERNSSNRYKAL